MRTIISILIAILISSCGDSGTNSGTLEDNDIVGMWIGSWNNNTLKIKVLNYSTENVPYNCGGSIYVVQLATSNTFISSDTTIIYCGSGTIKNYIVAFACKADKFSGTLKTEDRIDGIIKTATGNFNLTFNRSAE